MRKIVPAFLTLILLAGGTARATGESLVFGRFGTVAVYRETPHPAHRVLFVSGDGGWNLGVVDMAKALASLDSLVVGIDITHYLRQLATSSEKCSYPAADFEALSQFVQKKLEFPEYETPVLVGFSSGATLVYATLAQAPPNTFRGALSLGFCPDLPLRKPLCRQNHLDWTSNPRGKGSWFLPARELDAPWVALHGVLDQTCLADDIEKFARQVGNSQFVLLPKVGHGFSVERNWMPQFASAFARLAGEAPAPPSAAEKGLEDIPLVEVPAASSEGNTMAVIISGDGGWASLDKEVGDTLAGHGLPVVGLNSLKYFWTARTPDSSSKDLERLIRYYSAAWKKDRIVLIGYSRGADVLPFMANRLPKDILDNLSEIALLGVAHTVDFQFHVTDWLGGGGKNALPIRPEVEKLRGLNVVCFYGEGEGDSLCPELDAALARPVALKGKHHFGGNYQAIAERILQEMRR